MGLQRAPLPPAPVAAPAPAFIQPPNIEGVGTVISPSFATQIAGPDTYLAPLPTAIVLLKQDKDPTRNRNFCEAFKKLPSAPAAMAASVVAPNVILTRWPVNNSSITKAQASDCAQLVLQYDYQRATSLMNSVHVSQGSFKGKGPFLLMMDSSGHVAAADGSSYSNFVQFTASWQNALNQTQNDITAAKASAGATDQSSWIKVFRAVLNFGQSILQTLFPAAGGVVKVIIGTIQAVVCPT